MKAIYITGVFCFLFCWNAHASTPERKTLWKEFLEVRKIVKNESAKEGIKRLDDFEKKDLSNYPDILCHTFILKAIAFFEQDQLDSANQSLNKAEILFDNHDLDSLKAKFYQIKGITFWKDMEYRKSISIHLKGLKYAENFNDKFMEMKLSYNLSSEYKNLMIQDSAKYFINRALNLARNEKDTLFIANCNHTLAGIEKRKGNLLKAMEHIFEAYKMAKIVKGDTEYTRYQYVAVMLHDIYYGLGNIPATLDLVNLIVKEKRSKNYLFNIEAYLLTKSSLLLRMDSLDSSALILAELEETHQISKNPFYHNQVHALKGGILYKKNQWEASENELSKLLPEIDSASINSPVEKIALQGYSQLAKLKLQNGDFKKCISICEEQLTLNLFGLDHKMQFYGILASAHKALGNNSEAYKYLFQKDSTRDTIDRFYQGSLRLSKEQEIIDQQKIDEIEKLKYKNELGKIETAQQRNLLTIGSILALLISGMLFLWGRQRKLVLENSLADVKQQLLKRQVNPHFIFNVLNSIQNSVLTHKKEKSIELISKFSKLTRQVLQNSDKVKVPIHEELLLLTNYMDLEKMRTKNKFDYEVVIDEDIDIYNEEIPSMILQLFIENAIWHGMLPKDEKGIIKVIIERNKSRIKVIISDDGIGREMSVKSKTKDQQEKVSMGMNLIRQRIESLNKKYKDNIELYINDGMNGEGTQVLLIV